ncbi:hypothetical protein ACPCUX_05355 [Cellulosimicrobium sp. AB352]|uniref:hypothetical protein n=1 Tax=Cellulosimicrobium sp. AB352 TaxID=3413281 RepID=UPI003C1C6E5C
MTGLPFVPHYDPQSDFLITRSDSPEIRERMLSLGATAAVRDGFTAYLWNSRLGDRFLLGVGVLDGQLLLGPRRLGVFPARLGAGNYTVVELSESGAVVQPDLFGMNTVYYSESLVTNRLHLAAMVARRVDADNALSSTYNDGGFSFSFNTFKTPVQGVSLLPAGARVAVSRAALSVTRTDSSDEFVTCEPEDYWALIERGAQEVVDNVVAVVDSGLPVFADITGGRDSRVVFGALVAAGKQREVVFNTIANPATEGLRADLEIGTGLVSHYGGTYSERPRAAGYAEHSVDQQLQRRRSQVFGAYHWIVPTDLRTVTSLGTSRTIRMLGGGGELYRDYWRPMLFTSVDPDERANDENVYAMLSRHRTGALGLRHFDRYSRDLVETFRDLPGETMGHKLDAHYLNFRNRFHFGSRQTSAESMSTLNVATSPALLAASRALPARERASGRVLFDVIKELDEELAYLPFDKPEDPAIRSSRFHRRSRYDTTVLDLAPAVHLAKDVADRRGFLRPRHPNVEPLDFESVLDSEITAAVGIISDPASPFSFVVDEELESSIEWARAYSPRNRSSFASKLRAFADFSLL